MPVLSTLLDRVLIVLAAIGISWAAPIDDKMTATTKTNGDIPAGYHAWTIDEAQKGRLSDMLNVDFKTLNVEGTVVNSETQDCEGCGKTSGFDDFVYGALKQGVHDPQFMVRVLKERQPNPSPPHDLECSNCDTKFKRQMQWAVGFNWVF